MSEKQNESNQQEQETNLSSAPKPISSHGHIQMPNAVLFKQAGEELRADKKRKRMYGELISGSIPECY